MLPVNFVRTNSTDMPQTFEDLLIEKKDYSNQPVPAGDYDNCTFRGCNFSQSDLSGINFTDCLFEECNLGNARLLNSTLNDVRFRECKMPGLGFETTSPYLFTVEFTGCQLDYSSFFQRKLKKTLFDNCSLKQVDFTDTDLTEAVFRQCNFDKAKFENTLLEKADLRTSFGYSIDPELNRISRARFAWPALLGLLEKYRIEAE